MVTLDELLDGRVKSRVARALGVTPTALFVWRKAGTFPQQHLGGIAAYLGVQPKSIAHLARPEVDRRIVSLDALPAIERAYRSGETLAQIGNAYGVTRERIRQLLSLRGLNGDCGGAKVRRDIRLARRRASLDAKYLAKYGMTRDEYLALRGDDWRQSPQLRYRYQERAAHQRGIGWEFNFASWWKIWSESGKWAQRGRGYGYVMARFNDNGPYSPDNVKIIKATENVAEYYDRERATYGRVRRGPDRKAA